MKRFLLQHFQQDNSGQFLKYDKLIPISIVLSLISMPLCAQNNYLFPSDITDQAEQSQYDIGRENRYENNKQWVYPNASQLQTHQPVNYGLSQQRRTNHQAISGQSSEVYGNNQYQSQNLQSYSNNVEPRTNWYGESEHYKYGDFKLNQASPSYSNQQYQPQNTRHQPYFSAGTHYPEEYSSVPLDIHNAQKQYLAPYQSQMDNMKYRAKSLPQRTFLYPGDIEGNQWSKKSNSNPFNFNSFDSYPNFDQPNFEQKVEQKVEQNRQNVQIQYVPVPVPVYRVPGTLPGTVPGVVTPGNMVPGYSHISPNSNFGSYNQGMFNNSLLNQTINSNAFRQGVNQGYNPNVLQQEFSGSNLLNRKGFQKNSFNPLMGTQYNPLNGMSGFPGMTSPFDTFYKSYDNHSQMTKPFSAPETMIPGVSMPSMFSSQ